MRGAISAIGVLSWAVAVGGTGADAFEQNRDGRASISRPRRPAHTRRPFGRGVAKEVAKLPPKRSTLATVADETRPPIAIRIIRPYATDHERDAIAAALDAYRSHKNKLTQIERKAPEGIDLDEIKALILKGHSLESAVALLKKPFASVEDTEIVDTSPDETLPQQDVSFYRMIIKRQDEQITRLVSYVKELKQTIVEDQQNIVRLTGKIDFLKSKEAKRLKMSKEITLRDKEIKRLSKEFGKNKKINKDLQRRIKTLKKMSSVEVEEPLKAIHVLKSFNKDSIQLADEQYGLFDSIVLFEDASGGGIAAVDMLAEKKVKAIIVKNEPSHTAQRRLFEAEIPVFSVDDLRLKAAAGMMTIDRDALDKKIEDWHKKTSEVKRQERTEWLESMVEAYKSKRGGYIQKKSMP